MPEYEISERHNLLVSASAEATFATTCELKMSPGFAQALFKTRELILNCAAAVADSESSTCSRTKNQQEQTREYKEFLPTMKAVGWGVLAEIPGREIVLGAVTQPWVAKPAFRAVRSEEFAAFQERGHVKIVLRLRADPVNSSESIARTETRAATTDPVARAKFRRYWALASPGVILIRHSLLRSAKTEAERRARELKTEYETAEFGKYAG